MENEKFEKILIKSIAEFRDISKFGFIGIMGSFNLSRNIDFVITPSEGVQKGDFLKSLCHFLDLLKKNLSLSGANLIAFTHSMFQEEVRRLGKKQENDIFLHLVSFPDISPVNPEVIDSILSTTRVYFGKNENLNKLKATKLDYYYNYLFFVNCLFSNYPKEVEDEKIRERILYITKHNGSLINLNNKSNQQIFFECCDFLDNKFEGGK